MVQLEYGSTDPNDADYDWKLAAIAEQYKDKPVSLQSAIVKYALELWELRHEREVGQTLIDSLPDAFNRSTGRCDD